MTTTRAPRQDRSVATRNRVLDAAVDALVELGYAGTTAGIVADRAGVSRGAMQYHFRTKGELLAAAMRHLVERMGAEMRKVAARLPDNDADDRMQGVIDLLWASGSRPLMAVWLELNIAARTDPELDAHLAGLRTAFTGAIRKETFALVGAEPHDEAAALFIEMTLAMMTGLVTARMTGIGTQQQRARREAQILAAWKAAAPAVISGLRESVADGQS